VLPVHDELPNLQLVCIKLAPGCPDRPCLVLCEAGLRKVPTPLSTFTCFTCKGHTHAICTSSLQTARCDAGIHGSFTEQYLGPTADAKPQSYNISNAVAHDGVPVYA